MTVRPLAKNFGPRIRSLRESLGLTQVEIGEKLGVRHATVSFWENEKATPTTGYLHALANLTGEPERMYKWLKGGGTMPPVSSSSRSLPIVPSTPTNGEPLVGSQEDIKIISECKKAVSILLGVLKESKELSEPDLMRVVHILYQAIDGYAKAIDRLRALMSAFPSSFVEIDPETLTILDARLNPVTGSWTSLDKLVGHDVWQFTVPEDQDRARAETKRAWEEGHAGPFRVTLATGDQRAVTIIRTEDRLYCVATPVPIS